MSKARAFLRPGPNVVIGVHKSGMADAIDNSEIVCYCLSQEYKESANCKLEALYAHQAGVNMVPLMLQGPEEFRAKGGCAPACEALFQQ